MGCYVHSGAPWESLVSFGRAMVVAFIRARPWDRWVHSGARCGVSGSFWSVGFTRARPGGGRVYLGSLRSFGCVVVFIRARPGGCWVQSDAPRGHSITLKGSFRRTLGVVGFIRERSGGRWVYSGAYWWLSGSLWIVGTRPGGRRLHSVHSGAPWKSFDSFWRVLGLSGLF